ncbi:hypothetical protein [Parabacteroides bouchesdurhonensis]|uniref:hypothetical protein n=1 Tax=Parabacteroides bouchesdurhonensis TaxID=1936995 RepID=UPI001D0C601B|nr:hypothetical protein [Parabacteroides bouchesdurhonensis]
MWFNKFTLCGLLSALFVMTSSAEKGVAFETAVRTAVTRQMVTYPKSTLKDLYKNFFQDKFGPGHIINDVASAARYLRHEMDSYSNMSGEVAEPTGWEGNFYRVNLSVLKKGIIPYDVFLEAFVRSVNGIQPVSIEKWRDEWHSIETIIRSMNLFLPDYEADKAEIEKRLANGEYVGHHSSIFEETYSPHYRIISKLIFEKELLPLLLTRNPKSQQVQVIECN